jgi:hypothetical protein
MPVADPRSKFSAHAMGNLVSPLNPETNDRAWVAEAWLWWLARDEGHELREPAFLDLPVTHALVVAHADDYRLIRTVNRGKSYDEGIKPFDTLLLAHLDRFLLAEGSPHRLLAPWEPDPTRWLTLDWEDPATGGHYSLQTRPETGSYRRWQKKRGAVFSETFRSYLEKHFPRRPPTRPDPHRATAARRQRDPPAARTPRRLAHDRPGTHHLQHPRRPVEPSRPDPRRHERSATASARGRPTNPAKDPGSKRTIHQPTTRDQAGAGGQLIRFRTTPSIGTAGAGQPAISMYCVPQSKGDANVRVANLRRSPDG